MALNKGPLSSSLQSSLASLPGAASTAAQSWADAIAAHVLTGQSPQGVPPTSASVNGGKGALASALTSAFGAGSASGAASAISAGVVAFYQVLLFTGATPGVVTGVTGAGALTSAMSAAFAANAVDGATMAEVAGRFADAIHACAQSVVVTHSAPSAVTGPLT